MARGMCCVVLSMYKPSADSSFLGCLSHMEGHMTTRGLYMSEAGRRRCQLPIWIPKHCPRGRYHLSRIKERLFVV